MEPVPVTDPADPRVDDYRALHDVRARRRMEAGGDGHPGFFVAEGGHAVERLLASGRRVRSVLLDRISELGQWLVAKTSSPNERTEGESA